jgi:hypothetical protein
MDNLMNMIQSILDSRINDSSSKSQTYAFISAFRWSPYSTRSISSTLWELTEAQSTTLPHHTNLIISISLKCSDPKCALRSVATCLLDIKKSLAGHRWCLNREHIKGYKREGGIPLGIVLLISCKPMARKRYDISYLPPNDEVHLFWDTHVCFKASKICLYLC